MNDHLHPIFQQILKDSIMPELLTPNPHPINAAETKDKLRVLIDALVMGRAKHKHHASQASALLQAANDIEKQICEAVNDGHLNLEGKLFYSGTHAIQIADEWWDHPDGEKVRIFEVVR